MDSHFNQNKIQVLTLAYKYLHILYPFYFLNFIFYFFPHFASLLIYYISQLGEVFDFCFIWGRTLYLPFPLSRQLSLDVHISTFFPPLFIQISAKLSPHKISSLTMPNTLSISIIISYPP